MAVITKPNTFTKGTKADPAKVNANFDTIYNEVNGNLDNANIKATAGIEESKIAFNKDTGHDHDGVNSKSAANALKLGGKEPSVYALISNEHEVVDADTTKHALGSARIYYGLDANKPTELEEGRMYYASDTDLLYMGVGLSNSPKPLMPFVTRYMTVSDTNILVESLSEVRSAIVGNYTSDSTYSYITSIANKVFKVAYPGTYRITGEFRVSNGTYITATVLGVTTSATSYVPFSADVEVSGIGNNITIQLALSKKRDFDATHYGYMRNVRVKAAESTVPPSDTFVSQATY